MLFLLLHVRKTQTQQHAGSACGNAPTHCESHRSCTKRNKPPLKLALHWKPRHWTLPIVVLTAPVSRKRLTGCVNCRRPMLSLLLRYLRNTYRTLFIEHQLNILWTGGGHRKTLYIYPLPTIQNITLLFSKPNAPPGIGNRRMTQ